MCGRGQSCKDWLVQPGTGTDKAAKALSPFTREIEGGLWNEMERGNDRSGPTVKRKNWKNNHRREPLFGHYIKPHASGRSFALDRSKLPQHRMWGRGRIFLDHFLPPSHQRFPFFLVNFTDHSQPFAGAETTLPKRGWYPPRSDSLKI